MKRKFNGFTLSETLIVVVVLGVIATLTIPALVNKNKESVAKTKVRKAMAAYESALNKMIIENDLKSDDTLVAWAGANCANSTNYFKKVQGDGCIFKTSDGIWWNISDIERPVISFKEINTDNAATITTNANNANDKTAFVLVGRFGTDGSLRVDDLAYETANSIDDANGNASKAQVEKLYSLLGIKSSNAGGGKANCDASDRFCQFLRKDFENYELCDGNTNINCYEAFDFDDFCDYNACESRRYYDKDGNLFAFIDVDPTTGQSFHATICNGNNIMIDEKERDCTDDTYENPNGENVQVNSIRYNKDGSISVAEVRDENGRITYYIQDDGGLYMNYLYEGANYWELSYDSKGNLVSCWSITPFTGCSEQEFENAKNLNQTAKQILSSKGIEIPAN